MYEREYATKLAVAEGQQVLANPTVEENINSRIEYHEREIARLRQSKEDLKPLLGMRIRDIRSAMEY